DAAPPTHACHLGATRSVRPHQVVGAGDAEADAGQRDRPGVELEWRTEWMPVILEPVQITLEDRHQDRDQHDEHEDAQADRGGAMVQEADYRELPETELAWLRDLGDDEVLGRRRGTQS